MKDIELFRKDAFCVIGKAGSTNDGPDFVRRLWQDANVHYAQVENLAKKDKAGNPVGFWGAMSDMSRSFRPWQENFSRGLYLAGVECPDDAQPPEGWVKWSIPGYEYLYAGCGGDGGENIFKKVLGYMEEQGLTLAGAIHDFTCPRTGKSYLFFPIRRL